MKIWEERKIELQDNLKATLANLTHALELKSRLSVPQRNLQPRPSLEGPW